MIKCHKEYKGRWGRLECECGDGGITMTLLDSSQGKILGGG